MGTRNPATRPSAASALTRRDATRLGTADGGVVLRFGAPGGRDRSSAVPRHGGPIAPATPILP